MHRNNTRQLNENQAGFASIVIALVLIVVLALLTVGFAQLARHEQQNALDKQLAIQANDAAESGLNDAYQDIKNNKITSANASTTNCMTGSGAQNGTKTLPTGALTAGQTLDSTRDVSYTCLLVDLTPDNLVFNDVAPGSGVHATFGTVGAALNQMTVSWGSGNGHNAFPPSTATQLPPISAWHDAANKPYPPVVSLSLTPLNAVDRAALTNSTFNVYLYPAASGSGNCVIGTVTYPNCVAVGSGQGKLVSGGCNTAVSVSYPCRVTITGLSGTDYLVRFNGFYDSTDMLIKGNGPGGQQLRFSGEPQIDVTGKAKNVLKRLRARFLINSDSGVGNTLVLPNSSIEAQNICKRFGTAPSTGENPNGTNFDTGTGDPCDLSK